MPPKGGTREEAELTLKTALQVAALARGSARGERVAGFSGVGPFYAAHGSLYALPAVSVVITHYNRPEFLPQAIRSVADQAYPAALIELVVIDDGSPDPNVTHALDRIERDFQFPARGWKLLREPNRYLGGARNAALARARGEYVLFMDDDNYAKPHEVQDFVRVMENTRADVLTSALDFVWGKDPPDPDYLRLKHTRSFDAPPGGKLSPSFAFLGGSAEAGLFKNSFGDANSFVRVSSFEELGGYTLDKHVGYEDWEFYSKVVIRGYRLQSLPTSQYHYRFTSGSMQKSTRYSKNRTRALREYLKLLGVKPPTFPG